jgi:2-haloalkanoic acid dehalogenase type II
MVDRDIDLITFDIFGTVLNWFEGMRESVARKGAQLDKETFDRVINYQGDIEQKQFATYTEVTAKSLTEILGMNSVLAAEIGAHVGEWPLFPDSIDALHALMKIAPCAAMTNSDRVHGEQVQRQLGFNLSHWFCAEDVRVYKPNPEFWQIVSQKTKTPFSKKWWHVSAHADYDLKVAGQLGLTTVFVERNHSRPGTADIVVKDLLGLEVLFRTK